eukprot:TRINITY_DN30023_c2_g1_i1.p1 TRINITY_DN30023_c2_g1~~TRINITY_DN30023_c2_g1_i1.p1  ORF type:complete len:671 (-),score=190.74 TRINITY_DN30023_c2_g1_i1:124-2136(-)
MAESGLTGDLNEGEQDAAAENDAGGEGSAQDRDLTDERAAPVAQPILEATPPLWPFLNTLDDKLSSVTSSDWPFARSEAEEQTLEELADAIRALKGASMRPLDLALLTKAVAALPADSAERAMAVDKLQGAAVEDLLPSCSAGVLASLVALPQAADCARLVRVAAGELLKRPLRLRHAAVLLAALPGEGSQSLPSLPILRAASEALQRSGSEELDYVSVVAALEGLARLRCGKFDAKVDEMLPTVSAALIARLGAGAGSAVLARLAVGTGMDGGATRDVQRALAFRSLAALWSFPEAVGSQRFAALVSSLVGVRWPTHLPPGVSEEEVAAAACTFARCGAWSTARCGHLFTRALRRWRPPEGEKSAMPPAASALWLCAAAQSGIEDLAELTRNEGRIDISIDAALDGVEALLDAPAVGLSEETAAAASLNAARGLWALHAMEKAEERDGLAGKLADRIAQIGAKHLPFEAWCLLREVEALSTGGSAGGDDASSGKEEKGAAEDAAEGDASTEDGGEESAAASSDEAAAGPFGGDAWRQGFQRVADAEAALLKSAVGTTGKLRLDELKLAVAQAGVGLENPLGGVEDAVAIGPYQVALKIADHSMAIDFDVYQSSASRTLRRRQWETLAGDLRVAEIGLAQWDRADKHEKIALVRRRIEGVEDPTEEVDEE